MASLAGSITSVAFGLAGSLILDDAGDTAFVGGLSLFDLCSGSGFERGLALRDLGKNALLLLNLRSLPLSAARFPGGGNGLTLGLFGCLFWRSRIPCGAIGIKKGGLGFGGGCAAIGEIIVSGVFQILGFLRMFPCGPRCG